MRLNRQFYPTLIKHVERQPMKLSRQGNLPILIGTPDLPVMKYSKKLSVRRIKDRPEYVADYVLKHAKRNAAIMDEILILPKSPKDASPRDNF
jgi:hypothetical protein